MGRPNCGCKMWKEVTPCAATNTDTHDTPTDGMVMSSFSVESFHCCESFLRVWQERRAKFRETHASVCPREDRPTYCLSQGRELEVNRWFGVTEFFGRSC